MDKFKVLLLSDTHGQRVKNLPSADLLIHSGDWSCSGIREDTNKFLIWMASIRMDYKKVIVVPGNHDKWIEKNIPLAKEEFKKIDVDLLIDESVFFYNHVIYGMPWTPEFCNWAFMLNDIEMQVHCDGIDPNTTILVSHGPPYGYLDLLAPGSSEPGQHAGSKALTEAILRIKPKLSTFGHLHEGSGIQMLGETLLINASCMDEDYRLVNGFKVVYL